MATQQDVFNELQNIKAKILEKGGTITQANINVSLPELTAGVDSIPTGGGAGFIINTAELPNTTIQLYDSNNTLKDTQSTGESGGKVEFTVTEPGEYTVKALKDGVEIWSNTVTLDEIGVYNCKTGKALNDYSWEEIQTAGAGDYAKFMWSVGDTKDLSAFLGQTSSTYTRAILIDFNHDDLADGTGKAPITFKLPYTSSTYKHRSASGSNGVSWIGSLIRQNAVKAGEACYVYDNTITSSSAGTYYKYNAETNAFDAVTLPDNFDATIKYYTKVEAATDGAFIAGLPDDVKAVIKQVNKKTWTGYVGTSSNTDNTIIETKDWMFLLSDREVFGDTNRFVTYSRYEQEGKQYEYFKTYAENKLRYSNGQWLRSPYAPNATNFCGWSSGGYVTDYTAHDANRVALCFCV